MFQTPISARGSHNKHELKLQNLQEILAFKKKQPKKKLSLEVSLKLMHCLQIKLILITSKNKTRNYLRRQLRNVCFCGTKNVRL